MIAAFALSAFPTWPLWRDAADTQAHWFIAALTVAVIFNLWFGVVMVRLTQRLDDLGEVRAPQARRLVVRIALLVGVACELVAMVLPPVADVQILVLPELVVNSAELIGKLGSGALLAWVITLHGRANSLARDALDLAQR
ncbi:MAG: hypothetical protein HOI95_17260 [Chromatiales bacterium]|nr:hypothetical protein [Chromatiales bacterium]